MNPRLAYYAGMIFSLPHHTLPKPRSLWLLLVLFWLFSCNVLPVQAQGLLSTPQAGLKTPTAKVWQSELQFLGVSTDLTEFGAREFWIDEAGKAHCEVSVYEQSVYRPIAQKTLTESDPAKIIRFRQQCEELSTAWVSQHSLQKIGWQPAQLQSDSPSIQQPSGELSDSAALYSDYPALTGIQATAKKNQVWEVLVKSDLAAISEETAQAQPTSYRIVVRPQLEPIPIFSVSEAYETTEGQALLMPIKLWLSDHYGLMVAVLRDYRENGAGGFNYRYRPVFLGWPSIVPMTVEEATQTLNRAEEYGVDADPLTIGPNHQVAGFRALRRLQMANLPEETIVMNLQQATPAGKLYWMVLLRALSEEAYADQLDVLKQNVHRLTEIIVRNGEQWDNQPFQQVLAAQAQLFSVEPQAEEAVETAPVEIPGFLSRPAPQASTHATRRRR